MSNFQLSSVLVDTYTGVIATPGLYLGQRAIVTDYNHAEMYWSSVSGPWKWAKTWQLLDRQHTAFTLANAAGEQTAYSHTLPPLSGNDMIRVEHFWTNNASTALKEVHVNLGSTGVILGFKNDLGNNISNVSANFVSMFRNRASQSDQAWFSNARGVYGRATVALVTTNQNTATSKTLAITGTRTVSGTEVMRLDWADIWICGGD